MSEGIGQIFRSFPYAIAAGLVVAAACSLLGLFVILRRVVFIGITLSETSACGVALAMVVGLPPIAGAVLLTLAAVALLALPFENHRVPRDAVLGVLFVAASSLSILLVARSGYGIQEVKALLYGDLILASRADAITIIAILAPVLLWFFLSFRPTLYSFLDRDTASVLGTRPAVMEMAFFLALGLTVAAASKVAGTLLVFCYLIVPPATALVLSRRIQRVLALAPAAGAAATLLGLSVSFKADLPTNQTISVVACSMLAAGVLGAGARRALARLRRRPTGG
jgi:ABC-type Mn2+/Zn2+ transport system permease subunit